MVNSLPARKINEAFRLSIWQEENGMSASGGLVVCNELSGVSMLCYSIIMVSLAERDVITTSTLTIHMVESGD